MSNIIKFKNSIKFKILLAFSIFVIIPIVIIFFYSYYTTEKVIQQKVNESTQNTLYQISNNLEYIIDSLSVSSNVIIQNPTIQSILNKENHNDYSTITIKRILENSKSLIINANFDVTLITLDGFIYSTLPLSTFDYNSIKETDWYNTSLESKGFYKWQIIDQKFLENINHNKTLLSLTRLVADSFRSPKAIIVLSIPTKEVLSRLTISNEKTLGQDKIYIVDKKGEILTSSSRDQEFDQFISQTFSNFTSKDNYISKYFNNEKWLFNYRDVKYTGWKIISCIRHSELTSEVRTLRQRIIPLIAAIFLVFVTIYYNITTRALKPIQKLAKSMKQAESGNLDIKVDQLSKDEIGMLTMSYNSMLKELDYLIKENQKKQKQILKEETLKKDYKYKMLESQINPHFLFNIINNIKWMALINNSENVADMLASLGNLLEIGLGKKGEEITIEEEKEYLSNYIKLQKTRYADRLNVKLQIPQSLYKYSILRLLLQPILENAIQHGVCKKDFSGCIFLNAYKNSKDIFFQITDSGVGIAKDKLDEINTNLKLQNLKTMKHIGLRSVSERIKYFYGESYYLKIDSVIDRFTKVTIKIPKKEL